MSRTPVDRVASPFVSLISRIWRATNPRAPGALRPPRSRASADEPARRGASLSQVRGTIWLALLAAAAPAWADPAADEAAIRQRFLDWTAAFEARDAAGVCDLFAPDLQYAIPDQLQGTRETMCGNLARVLARDDLRLHYDAPAIHEILVSGDLATVRLTWTLTTEAGGRSETTTEEGIDVFRRQPDGRWSIARFIAFTTRPNGLLQDP